MVPGVDAGHVVEGTTFATAHLVKALKQGTLTEGEASVQVSLHWPLYISLFFVKNTVLTFLTNMLPWQTVASIVP